MSIADFFRLLQETSVEANVRLEGKDGISVRLFDRSAMSAGAPGRRALLVVFRMAAFEPGADDPHVAELLRMAIEKFRQSGEIKPN